MTDIMSVHVFAESATPATAKQINEQVQNSESTVYVFYSHPSAYVAHALEQGRSGSEVFENWLIGINEAFEAQGKNRRRLRLLCLQDALKNQQALAECTGIHTGSLSEVQAVYSPLSLLAAHQIVMKSDGILSIIDRLEAMTLHLSDEPFQMEIDVENVLRETKSTLARIESTSHELEQARGELLEKKEENELLLLQQQQIQEELEHQFIERENAELKHRDESSAYQHRNNELENENKELMLCIQQLKVKKSEFCVSSSSREGQVAKSAGSELVASEESELLMLQLQQVQEELEVYFIKYRDSEKERAKLKAELDNLKVDNSSHKRGDAENRFSSSALNSDTDRHFSKKNLALGKRLKQKMLPRIKSFLPSAKNKKCDKATIIQEQIVHLKSSEFFDSDWYLQRYSDVREAGVDPFEHYLIFGGFEGRDPSKKFNSSFYLESNPDVAKENINPLLHFVLFGKNEGRLPKPPLKSSKNSGVKD